MPADCCSRWCAGAGAGRSLEAPPLISHTLRSTTLSGAMRQAVETACAAEADGVLAVSVFAGFALADIAAPCVSVVVWQRRAAKADEQVAERSPPDMAARDGFHLHSEPLGESLARAQCSARGAAPGAAARSQRQLHVGRNLRHDGRARGSLEQGSTTSSSGPLCDPEAVAALAARRRQRRSRSRSATSSPAMLGRARRRLP